MNIVYNTAPARIWYAKNTITNAITLALPNTRAGARALQETIQKSGYGSTVDFYMQRAERTTQSVEK